MSRRQRKQGKANLGACVRRGGLAGTWLDVRGGDRDRLGDGMGWGWSE